MRAPLAPPRLSEPRKVEAEAHAVETSSDTLNPDCNAFAFSEGEVPGSPGTAQAKKVFTISAVACNSSACPDNAKSSTLEYTERRRVVTACGLQNGVLPLDPC